MTGNRRAASIVRRVTNRRVWMSHAPLMVLSSSAGNDITTSPAERFAPHVASWAARRATEVVLLCALLIASCLLVRAFFLESFFIPSTSMIPTLQARDRIVVTKLAYGLQLPALHRRVITWDSPRRGEVIVFTRKDDPSTHVDEGARSTVKRVIGVAGDTIMLEGAHVFVNGEPLIEPYARWSKGGAHQPQVFTVPHGALFVLGDNRDESLDSRSWNDPFIEEARVVGPVAVVY